MSSRIDGLPRYAVAVAAAVALTVAVLLILLVLGLLQRGRVLRGVSAADVSLGGLSADDAALVLAAALPATAGEIVLRDPTDDRTWTVPTQELGLAVDAETLAEAAMMVGRDGNTIGNLFSPVVLLLRGRDLLADPPFDEARARQTLTELAPEVDVAPEDAGFGLIDGEARLREPVYGRQMDVDATMRLLPDLARSPDRSTVDLVLITTAPRVYDVGSVAEAYERITSLPLTLNYRGERMATVDATQLAEWTNVTTTTSPEGDVVPAITVDEAAIRAFLDPFAADLNRPPANARLRLGEMGIVEIIEPAQPGLLLDVAASADSLIRGAYTQQRVAELVVGTVGPDVRDEHARSLSRNARALGQAYTPVGGMPEGRLRNLMTAAQRLDGLSVAPGARFSLFDALGEVSADAGYDMAQVTAGASAGTMYEGGLEQVATTAFRAAVWSGLPIDKRVSPEFRTAWVEPPIGLDAAVGSAIVDLWFTNDTDHAMFFGVAIDTVRQALAWTIYGVAPDRSVELIGPDVTDVTPAPREPLTVTTDLLPIGQREQARWARGGALVRFERIVTEAGAVLRHDTFQSSYKATPDVVLVGAVADQP